MSGGASGSILGKLLPNLIKVAGLSTAVSGIDSAIQEKKNT